MKVIVTKEEQKAIRSLERLVKRWPDSLQLFGWAGLLCVLKNNPNTSKQCVIETISGIYVDGGDPSDDEVEQDGYEIEYSEI